MSRNMTFDLLLYLKIFSFGFVYFSLKFVHMDAKTRNASVHWFIVRGCFLLLHWATSI